MRSDPREEGLRQDDRDWGIEADLANDRAQARLEEGPERDEDEA